MDCSRQGSSVRGTSQARMPEWVVISFSRGSSQPKDQSYVSCFGKWIFYQWATWESHMSGILGNKNNGRKVRKEDCLKGLTIILSTYYIPGTSYMLLYVLTVVGFLVWCLYPLELSCQEGRIGLSCSADYFLGLSFLMCKMTGLSYGLREILCFKTWSRKLSLSFFFFFDIELQNWINGVTRVLLFYFHSKVPILIFSNFQNCTRNISVKLNFNTLYFSLGFIRIQERNIWFYGKCLFIFTHFKQSH